MPNDRAMLFISIGYNTPHNFKITLFKVEAKETKVKLWEVRFEIVCSNPHYIHQQICLVSFEAKFLTHVQFVIDYNKN